jgi:hypothetical protein
MLATSLGSDLGDPAAALERLTTAIVEADEPLVD